MSPEEAEERISRTISAAISDGVAIDDLEDILAEANQRLEVARVARGDKEPADLDLGPDGGGA